MNFLSEMNTAISNKRGRTEDEWPSLSAQYDEVGLFIGDYSVVEHWEQPVQEALARSICHSSSARILEIGYGLGLAAKIVTSFTPTEHTIVEAHPDVVCRALTEMPPSTHIISGLWEQIVPSLNSDYFDGIIYDAYPMTGNPFDGSSQSTFSHVRPFLSEGARLLQKGGLLGFLDYSCAVTLLEDFNFAVGDLFSEFFVKKIEVEVPNNCSFARGNCGHILILKK
jgi:guanidinoacetate N-methyltransferase